MRDIASAQLNQLERTFTTRQSANKLLSAAATKFWPWARGSQLPHLPERAAED
jgi:hypothetical protein